MVVKHGGRKVLEVSLPLVAHLIVENSRINLSLLFRIIEKGKIQVASIIASMLTCYIEKIMWVLTC